MTRAAFVNDWLTVPAGTEAVLGKMLEAYPGGSVYALVHNPEAFEGTPLAGVRVRTSLIQRLPRAATSYRMYLPLMPLLIEQFDVDGFDVVVSNVKAVAHGVLTSAEQLHVAYLNRTMRYAWDHYHRELKSFGFDRGLKGILARIAYHYLRLWDFQAMQRPDVVVANSQYVADRVRNTYRRDATVIYPPVSVEDITPTTDKDDYFVTATRLVPYKRVDVVVRAFNELGLPLKVLGDGPMESRLRDLARENVEFLGWVPREELVKILQSARALVFAADEEFGIAPVEAQAAATPVIAYGRGGLAETVIHGKTGLLYQEQAPEALIEAVRAFLSGRPRFEPEALRVNAERFSSERFREELTTLIERERGSKSRKRPGRTRARRPSG